jgi:CRP-like cAMP-binding protein
VKQVVVDALADCPLVLENPAPVCGILDFGASAVQYRAKFWIADWALDDTARDQVRTAIYYAFRRRDIEIPYPIHVEHKLPPPSSALASAAERRAFIEATDLFRSLPEESRDHLAEVARERLFGDGQTVVHQDEAGDSLFVVGRGRVRVTIKPGRTQVATIDAGGYFGEMSLLTGQPRTASVSAIGDCLLLEISTAEFREMVQANPSVLEQVTASVAERQAGLARSREVMAASVTAVEAPRSFLLRVREFLKL